MQVGQRKSDGTFKETASFETPVEKPAPQTEIVDCCTNCKREDRGWYYVDETIKYDWKKTQTRTE